MCDGIGRIFYSGGLGTQNKSAKELNFRESFDYHEEKKELLLVVEPCDVKGVAAELMNNGSSPRYTEIRA